MNPPETPLDTLRALRRKPETRTGLHPEGEPPAGEFEPRYIDVPRHRRAQLAAERNLKWGLALLLLALGLIGAALIVSGPRSLVPVVICLVTFTILWTMARCRVFHQRNGVFFAAAMVCLLGASIPMIERGYIALDRMAHSAPVATDPGQTALASQKTPEPPPVAEPPLDLDLPSLVDALKIPVPSDARTNLVRIVESTKILVGRKPYMLHAGDTFILDEIKDGQFIFRANEMRLAVPERAAELMSPPGPEAALAESTPEPPAPIAPPRPIESRVSDRDLDGATTERAQAEAMRRYPALGVKGSVENALFLEKMKQLRAERPDFFDDEEWPLFLAEGVAKEHGWQRAP